MSCLQNVSHFILVSMSLWQFDKKTIILGHDWLITMMEFRCTYVSLIIHSFGSQSSGLDLSGRRYAKQVGEICSWSKANTVGQIYLGDVISWVDSVLICYA